MWLEQMKRREKNRASSEIKGGTDQQEQGGNLKDVPFTLNKTRSQWRFNVFCLKCYKALSYSCIGN